MINVHKNLYQELISEYNRLSALYRRKIHQSIEQWNRQQHEELSRTLAGVRAEIEELRKASAAPALLMMPAPVKL